MKVGQECRFQLVMYSDGVAECFPSTTAYMRKTNAQVASVRPNGKLSLNHIEDKLVLGEIPLNFLENWNICLYWTLKAPKK